MRHRSSNLQPHPAILPHLRWLETPDMAQSGGGPQEALGTSWDTVANCGLHLTHRTENLAWPGKQKKKKKHLLLQLCEWGISVEYALWFGLLDHRGRLVRILASTCSPCDRSVCYVRYEASPEQFAAPGTAGDSHPAIRFVKETCFPYSQLGWEGMLLCTVDIPRTPLKRQQLERSSRIWYREAEVAWPDKEIRVEVKNRSTAEVAQPDNWE